MVRYKEYSFSQGSFIPVYFDKQILTGTFEYSLACLIDDKLDLSLFEAHHKNDHSGAPPQDPAVLLKIILYAYFRGIVSNRKIARCCRGNIIFMDSQYAANLFNKL
jgi:transposase